VAKAVIRGALLCALGACLAHPALAAFPVVFGTSWDPPSTALQTIVEGRYGAGALNITTDYIGAHPGDPDPWFWSDRGFSALIIREVAGNANRNYVGWYKESGTMPVIDGVDDGIVFDGPAGPGGMPVIITLGPTVVNFGFYMNPNGSRGAINAPEPECFFTNRHYNDPGLDGSGAVHAPADGDVQALVFDVSRWSGPNTWLVCFEDLDSGAQPAPCCTPTDNDYNDFVFEVTAIGTTPVALTSLGDLKARYRH
jgi:hypothetical protein